MKAPEPGIYQDVPAEDYHRWDAANYSTLKQFKKSAAHAYCSLMHPPDQTKSMLLGSRLNDAILQPEVWKRDYVLSPDLGDRRRKEAKDRWAAFQAQHASKDIVKQDEWYEVMAMRDSIHTHPLCEKLLNGNGLSEMSFTWLDVATGVLCKGRVDWYGSLWGNSVACDLKTTKDASPWGWPKEIANFQYHVQAAFYMDGLNQIAPKKDRTWLWLCVENRAPYCSAVYQAENVLIEEGRHLYGKYLERWQTCNESGIWPGYKTSLNMVDIPHWAYTSDEELGV